MPTAALAPYIARTSADMRMPLLELAFNHEMDVYEEMVMWLDQSTELFKEESISKRAVSNELFMECIR